jgi:hypothetical protein
MIRGTRELPEKLFLDMEGRGQRHIGKKPSGRRAQRGSIVLRTLCKVGELGETIEVASRLDQRIEASLRHSRFDKLIEASSRQSRICRASIKISRLHRDHQGYIVARSQKTMVHRGIRGLTNSLSLA